MFQSLPQSVKTKIPLCEEIYTEYDGREGSFKVKCSRPKNHNGYHGWGSPEEIRSAEFKADYNRRLKLYMEGKGEHPGYLPY